MSSPAPAPAQPPRFTLSPLEKSDIPRCVSIYFAAFAHNTHSLACWPRNNPTVTAWWTEMFHAEIHEPGAHWLKAISNSTGEVAGFCKWQEPKVLGESEKLPGKEDLPQWPEGADRALCDETFGAWAERRREVMGRRGHWYLEVVGTDPAYQGQGAGRQMLQWGISRADEDATEAYLEASPYAVALYVKFGFREVSRMDTFIDTERVKGEWYRETFMVRSARGSSS